MAQTFRTGAGIIRSLPASLAARGARKPFVIHGPSPVETERARAVFVGTGIEPAFFGDVAPNPDERTVGACLAEYEQAGADSIVAIGGGSVMDTAKLVIAFTSGATEADVLSNRFEPGAGKPPYFAAPTSAGSGSESTHFAVYYKNGKKHSLANQRLKPDEVFLDPELTLTCPRSLTLASGCDAVCQAVESFWSKGATEESRAYSKEALPALLGNLFTAVDEPSNLAAREAMLNAANLSGRAIDISKTTAAHAMSYGITSRYRIQHGLAVMLSIGPLIELMEGKYRYFDTPGYLDEAFAAYGPRFPVAFRAFRTEALSRMDEASRTAADGEGEAAVEELAEGVNAERLSNHPVKLTNTDIQDLYRRILAELGMATAEKGNMR